MINLIKLAHNLVYPSLHTRITSLSSDTFIILKIALNNRCQSSFCSKEVTHQGNKRRGKSTFFSVTSQARENFFPLLLKQRGIKIFLGSDKKEVHGYSNIPGRPSLKVSCFISCCSFVARRKCIAADNASPPLFPSPRAYKKQADSNPISF